MKTTIVLSSDVPNEKPRVLRIAVEVVSPDGKPPCPGKPDASITCVAVNCSSEERTVVYGHVEYNGDPFPGTYVKCESERDVITKALGYIDATKCDWIHADTTDLKYLYARAAKLRVRSCFPYIEKLFRQYDRYPSTRTRAVGQMDGVSLNR